MPRNIEIKARVHDMAALEIRAAALSDQPVRVLEQIDTFFVVPSGRLKLRVETADQGQLIFYQRPDVTGPKTSAYQIYRTGSPAALSALLQASLGVRGVVRKVRKLYQVGQTRVHLDRVESLGDFMELEVVLNPGQSETEGQVIAARLQETLGVETADLVRGAYLDLLP